MNTNTETVNQIITKIPGLIVILLVVGFGWMLTRIDRIEKHDLPELRMSVVRVEAKVDVLAEDVKELKEDMKELKGDMRKLRKEMSEIKLILLKKYP